MNMHIESGAHQMEPPSLLISWVNPFPSRVLNRTIFFCNALESHECACCLLSFLYFCWLFPLSARVTSPVNRSIYNSTRERVDSKGLCGRCRLHLMGSWYNEWMKERNIQFTMLARPVICFNCRTVDHPSLFQASALSLSLCLRQPAF